ncbi:DegT/DnrJ/EryC1/StrS aminotransferase family protein [Frigoribacterium sp. PhB24]|uniref:DegT/DnrJ/EryC1/StrS family aminotransferase n=1 Tax=Frigoribacterium sp. PhB24 TaxID=2485204 RepID=UPI000FB90987|nr:aminotransferase class I/II-fold pyridoxal phosphate-dependent enzyme [Frigoribacterium sp. PhB24]ROS54733.1 dTDP-4-amino-4,6-dideoxygalactose transaminase [Frigoribacterium sp. PhB24]
MTERIYMSSPDVGELEEQAVVAAMRGGWIAPLGPDVDGFERDVAARVGVDHGVALSSGTAALHVALVAWGVGPGDVVPTSTMTFAATANAIAYTGATPYFVDCDPETGNIDPGLLGEVLDELRAEGARVPVVVPVDLLGKAVDYTSILELADEHGSRVLSDAAESLGATHVGRAAGSFGDASVVSFNGNKIMTTSGGGMLLTDDGDLATRVRYLSTQARQPVTHYEHTEIGYNYRLSNLLAALGRAQLSRLDDMIARRRAVRDRYRAFFAGIDGVELFGATDDAGDNCWLTSILVDESTTGYSTAEISRVLAEDQIESRPLWKPMHLQPVFEGARQRTNGASESLFRRGLTLPSGSALSEAEVDRVLAALSIVMGEAGGRA